ncbi:MAG: hypothetical protein LBK53_05225 [Heliobacteriaceae bacterium]|jgi:hypothetical protein|nr:hypothetical protein [Heliobacteriaceae bacterium]
MKETISFLKDIFMIKSEDRIKVGLSQFKGVTPVERASVPQKTRPEEIKLSDLMRNRLELS